MRFLSVVALFCAVVCAMSQPFGLGGLGPVAAPLGMLGGLGPGILPPVLPPPIFPPFGLGMGFPFGPFGFPFGPFGFGRFGFGRFGFGRFGGFGRGFIRGRRDQEQVMEQLGENINGDSIDMQKLTDKKNIEKILGESLVEPTTVKKEVPRDTQSLGGDKLSTENVVETVVNKKEVPRDTQSLGGDKLSTENVVETSVDKKSIPSLDEKSSDNVVENVLPSLNEQVVSTIDKKEIPSLDNGLPEKIVGDKVVSEKEISSVESSKVLPESIKETVSDKKEISTSDEITPLKKKETGISGDKVVDSLNEVKKDLNTVISEKSVEEPSPKKACAKSGC